MNAQIGRPGWDKLMRYVCPNDTIIVTEIGRITRSLMDFLGIRKVLKEKEIEIVSLSENQAEKASAGCSYS